MARFLFFLLLALAGVLPAQAGESAGHRAAAALGLYVDPFDFEALEEHRNKLGATDQNFEGSEGIAIDETHHRFFLSDTLNNRVLIFNLDDNNQFPDQVADFVLGQPDFTHNDAAVSKSGMEKPAGLAVDESNNRLFVADMGNHRVLVYDTGKIINGMDASYVLGQEDFTAFRTWETSSGDTMKIGQTARSSLWSPYGLAYDSGHNRLFVADEGNSRILVFDAASLKNGMEAAYVLGQRDFVSRESSGEASQATISGGPYDVAYDGTHDRIFVSDRFNNRVLVYDTRAIQNGMNAAYVLGQKDFNASGENNDTAIQLPGKSYTPLSPTKFGLFVPSGLAYDSAHHHLYVADTQNTRVLVYDLNMIASGMGASYVLGQPDFTSNEQSSSERGIGFPVGLEIDMKNRRLYVTDTMLSVVAIYNIEALTKETP